MFAKPFFITPINWDADLKGLFWLFVMIVRSKLDYVHTIYGQESQSYLYLLDLKQNNGLQISTESFRSLTVKSLEVEGRIMFCSYVEITCAPWFFTLIGPRLQLTPFIVLPTLQFHWLRPPFLNIFMFLLTVLPYSYYYYYVLWVNLPTGMCAILLPQTKTADHQALLKAFSSPTFSSIRNWCKFILTVQGGSREYVHHISFQTALYSLLFLLYCQHSWPI